MPDSLNVPMTGRELPDFGHGAALPLPELCLHQSFEAWVDHEPDRPAIITSTGSICFGQLDGMGNHLAHLLLRLQIEPEEPVGVLVDRSASLPVAFLGILKAGGTYVPMLADLPEQRLANMAAQAGMRLLIALDGHQPPPALLAALTDNARGRPAEVLRLPALDETPLIDSGRPQRPCHPGQLAAILFTSGSTGRPKGVLLQHIGCQNMALGHAMAQGIRETDRLLLSSAPSFILGFRELCLPLALGCAWVPASRALLDRPGDLLDSMARHQVSVALLTPSYLRLLGGVVPAGLRLILTAGERPHPDDARHYARHVDYWNMHGATELCGTIAIHKVSPTDEGVIPSGRPFPNTTILLVDEQGAPVPAGADGEILVVSPGIARGYLNQPDLTADSFVETPFGRAYRTRDLGRWTQTGELLALGRAGDVVKVSGQAVSLGEIERALLAHDGVRGAAVVQHRGRLIGFVEPKPAADLSGMDWQTLLSASLPAYMVPALVLVLPQLPIASAGKVDRTALLTLAEADWTGGRGHGGPPQGAVEGRIAAIWAEVLGLSAGQIGREDDFFRLGGSSLIAIQLGQRLQAAGMNASVRDILGSMSIAALAQRLTEEEDPAGIEPEEHPAATLGQVDFWVAASLGLPPAAAHVSRVLRLSGAHADADAWRNAWIGLLRHHPALRTGLFADHDGTVRLRSLPADAPALRVALDTRHFTNEAEAGAFVAAQTALPFDLTQPPLSRAGLICIGDDAPLFWFVTHHALVDGMSAGQLQQDLLSLLTGRPLTPALDGPRLATRAERLHLASPQAERDRAYWLDMLAALPEEAFEELPSDRRRTDDPAAEIAAPCQRQLDAGVAARLTALANRHGAGLHAMLLALLALEMQRRTGRRQLLLGSGIATRPAGTENQLGHFVNLLPLPLAVPAGRRLCDMLRDAQTTLTGAVKHGLYPAGSIIRDLRRLQKAMRPAGRMGLVDVALTANPGRSAGDAGSSSSLTPVTLAGDGAVPAAGLDLSFSHEPTADGGVQLSLVWNANLFQPTTAEGWLSALAGWAEWLAGDTARLDVSLPDLLPAERQWLDRVETGPARTRAPLSAHRLVETIIDQGPDRPAIISRSGTTSYGTLEAQANRIAHALLAAKLGQEQPVAVLAENGPWLPAAALGIWKAGGVHLPLALEMPAERVAFILADAGARHLLLLPGAEVPAGLPDAVSVIRPAELTGDVPRPDIPVPPSATAYMIYTSGTTGAPKGTKVRHDGMINAILSTLDAAGRAPTDRVALISTPAFDASLWEMGLGLLHGLPLVPVTRIEREDPWGVKDLYRDLGVTIAFHAPSYLRVSQDKPFPPSLRVLLVGGEAPSQEDVARYPGIAFWNCYGPTETSIIVCLGRIAPDHPADRPLPVGQPLPGVVISIRDGDGARVPPGCTGEVWLGGVCVGGGYLNTPQQQAKAFVDTAEGRFYRSGDLGRWSADGLLELAGRIDHQVKLHGQRVEPAEIEQHLLTHPAVRQAAVIVDKGAGDTKLLRGFVHLHQGARPLSNEEWRGFLAGRLPPYMVPATIMDVPGVPVTANGKVDRLRLLAILRERGPDRESVTSRTVPQGALEQRIASAWARLLNLTGSDLPVAREDNFFALGGTSLLAVSLAHLLAPALGWPVTPRDLFAAPVLADFAARLVAGKSAAPMLAAMMDDRATEGEREFWVAQQAGLDTSGHIVPAIRRVTGPMPERARWVAAWQSLVLRQPGLRLGFRTAEDGDLRRIFTTAAELGDAAGLEWAEASDMDGARAHIRQRQLLPFDMATPPLWRAGLIQVGQDGGWLFWVSLHHSIGDGRSLGIILSELQALLQGRELAPLTADPAIAAARERAYLSGPDLAADAAWWADQLALVPDETFLPLPLDFPRRMGAEVATHRFQRQVEPALAEGLRGLARQHAVSLYALLVCLLAVEMGRRTGRQHLMLGTSVSTPESAVEAALVQYGVNMLPLPLTLVPAAPLATLLRASQQVLAGGLQHARYPFSRLYGDFWRRRPALRDPLRFPLFDVAVTENPPVAAADDGVRLERLSIGADGYELTHSAHGQDLLLIHEALAGGGIALEWHVNASLFSRDSAAAWLDGLMERLTLLATRPDLPALPLASLLEGAAPPPPAPRVTAMGEKSPARPGLEQEIAALWADMLGIAPPAREDNFFALGGNSLLAIGMAHRLGSRLGRTVSARDLFSAPALADFAARLQQGAGTDSINSAFDGRRATAGEQEFWTAQQAGLDTSGFTMPLIRRVRGPVPDIAAWRTAWATLVARHPALRCRLREQADGSLLRDILPELPAGSGLELAERADHVQALAHIRTRIATPLDLSQAPLWRVGLVRMADTGEWLFWLAQHHATGDGRSLGLLMAELLALLRGETLPALSATPESISSREQAYLAGDAAADAVWWRDLLSALPDAAFDDWASDLPRGSTAITGSHRHTTRLDLSETAGLLALARRHDTSLHALLTALLAQQVRRRTGRGDFLIGTTATMPETAAEAAVVHYGVNMLPLAFRATGDADDFAALLRHTGQELTTALAHGRYPFARMYHDFWAAHPGRRQPDRYPLFDIAITENPVTPRPVADDELRLERLLPLPADGIGYERMQNPPGQDMVLTHERLADGGLMLDWQTNAALYHADISRFWLEGLVGAARWLSAHGTQAAMPALLPAQQQQLAGWEQGPARPRPPLTFAHWFDRLVDQPGQAERPALLTVDGPVAYGLLERQANRLAHQLIATGVQPGQVVAVLTRRSVQLPATVLAIWKAGAVYLPLAADLPADRLCFMAADADAVALLALDGISPPPGLDLPLVDITAPAPAERPTIASAADDTAYILYTSGSTGVPKGVIISHGSYLNLLLGAVETYQLTPEDRCLGFAAPSFDVSLSDIGIPLAAGAALCPVPADLVDQPTAVAALIRDQRISVADLTPTYLRLLDTDSLSGLRILVTGGEAPLPADVARLAGRVRYLNAYGPTENAITSTMGCLSAAQPDRLDCGRPLPNTGVEIRDAVTGTRLPPGSTGEIWLAGVGLAQAYLNRPDLTETAFVQTAEGRRYRTGDLGRWRGDGGLEVLGRVDQQVKLNGIRIELGEIEAAITRHPGIIQAVVAVDGAAGERQSLWAFIHAAPDAPLPDSAGWRLFLGDILPAYMIPADILSVSGIPVTGSGKVDRAALLAGRSRQERPDGGTVPQPGLEQIIATLWVELLRSGPVRREDDFFSLGGHSLLAIALCHRLEGLLSRPVPARLLFADPVLAGFAARVAAHLAEPAPVIQAPPSDIATEGEREFWTAQQAGLETRGFIITLTLAVEGVVPADSAWHEAWATLTARHEAMRTRYVLDQDTDILKRIVDVESPGCFQISRAADTDTALADIRAQQGQAFDMAAGPLWRAGLVHVTGERPVFWLALHHAVGDGASLGLLMADLTALLTGRALPPPTGSFADSAGRERAHLLGLAGQADADWWRQKLAAMAARGEDSFADWPTDRPRPPVRAAGAGLGSHTLRLRLTPDQAQGLRRLARSAGTSLHVLLLTLMGLEVRRRTGRQDFLLGTAASTRASAAEAGIVGYYVTLLPLSFHLTGITDVGAALAATRTVLAEALAHSAYPFARIARDFRQDHPGLAQPGRYPLFDIAVTENPTVTASDSVPDVLRFVTTEKGALPDAGRIAYDLRTNAPAQDMVLVHEGLADGGLSLSWFVKADLYDRETAEAWLTGLADQMRGLLDRPLDQPASRLLPAEREQLARWEQGETLPAPADSVAARFSQLSRLQPDRPALITRAGAVSYAAMEGRANDLARRLIERGLRPGQTVGVYTERSATLPMVVLAIWKAGGCYMPLTHGLPAERLRFMAENAGIALLLALDGLTPPPALLDNVDLLLRPEDMALTENATPPVLETAADSPAYILHTSGSTGAPKGVVLSQRGLLNLAVGMAHITGATPEDRALLIASPSFDLWISDLLMVWGAGGAIVPVTKAEMDDITGMKAMLGPLGVTMATMAPSYLRLFDQTEFPALRFLMTVGEPPVAADARFYAARLAYFNGYGPTETTAAAAIGRIDPEDDPLPAGRPLPNSFILILDAQGERVPPGSVGEIWIGGTGVGIGYLNRPDLTELAFQQTPHGRMYRTGDMGRWRHDGQLLVLGRMDGQVKLRGQRVELAEIEQALARHPGVRHAAVLMRKAADGTQSLWGFVVPDGSVQPPPPGAGWQDFLGRQLPGYMIPSGILTLPALPVNMAGKIDRKALLATLEERLAAGELTASDTAAGEPPQGVVEMAVAAIWADILGRTALSRTDDFFDLGGDSPRAIATITRLRKLYSVQINDLYEHPVLADFARRCRPRVDHLRDLIQAAGRHWRDYQDQLPVYEAARNAALNQARADYDRRNQDFSGFDPKQRADYGHVLLTGATGYLGTYLLRQLLQQPSRAVTVLVRAADDMAARQRLHNVLTHYFGTDGATTLLGHTGLSVRAGNLRHPDLGLGDAGFAGLAAQVDGIVHSAANVSHIGHYSDFQADNVAATAHLLALAERHSRTSGGRTADLHLISTLSVCGRPPEDGFRLFTEYDPAPDGEEENYYVRSKQEAERLVLRARDRLANASIHRVGNVVFAADGSTLQRNIRENAFFRMMGALVRLGAVPDDSHLWLCHVDRVAEAVLALAESPALANLTHHVEHARRDTLADFITGAMGLGNRIAAVDFGRFLDKVAAAVDQPALETALAEILEGFGLHRGISPQARARRLELTSDRTQQFLHRLGVVWPAVPRDGQAAMVAAAHTLFTEPAGYRR